MNQSGKFGAVFYSSFPSSLGGGRGFSALIDWKTIDLLDFYFFKVSGSSAYGYYLFQLYGTTSKNYSLTGKKQGGTTTTTTTSTTTTSTTTTSTTSTSTNASTTTTTSTNASTTTNPTSTSTTTLPISPQVLTGSAKIVTSDTTILNGKVNPNGSEAEAYFEYGTTASYGFLTETQSMGSGSSDLSVTATIEDLIAETLYHYRIVAVNGTGTSYGMDKTFYNSINYVSNDATCGGNSPCYSTIQSAINDTETEKVVRICEENFDEDIITDKSFDLTLSGGWDSTFTDQSSDTQANSLTIRGTISGSIGTVKIDNIILK